VTLLSDIPTAPVCNGGPISVSRIYKITDCSGNSTTVIQTINVADITAPTISNIPANVSVSCVSEIPAPNTGAVVASDNCSGILTVTSNDVIIPGSCANRFTLNRTYTVSDCSGNSSSAVQVITVNDQTGPVLTPPATQILDVGAGAGCTVLMPDYRSLITATDACGGTVTLEQLAPNEPGSTVTGYGSTRTISFIGTDVCGNTSTTDFTLNLVDATAPNAVCQNITLDLDASGNASITPAMVNNGSNDNCSAVTLVSALPNTFNCSNVGANTVTLTVIDNAGNTSTCQSIVTVRDLIAPTISCWGDTTIAKGANCTNILDDLTFRINKTDNCAIASVTQNIPAGTVIGSSVQFVDLTLQVTDVNGNSSTCTFRVNFTDQVTPVISGCPSNITVNTGTTNTLCSQTVTWTAPTVADNCGIASFTSTHNSGDAFPVGTTTVIYTATDVNGNTATCSFTVTVIDNTKPIIAGCPANISLTSNAGNPATCSQIVTWAAPTAEDNCGIASFASTHNPGTVFLLGTTIVTYTATDIHGNTQTCSFTVTVVDDTKPDFTFCPSPVINAPTNGAGCIATIVTSNPIVSDNCTTIISLTWALTGATTGTSAGTGINYLGTYDFNVGTTTVTYTATDASGNTRNCSFTVSVVNTLSGTIGGTTTVVQNGSTTSNITFIGTSGIKPYTFTYNISVNGGAPGANQTVTTTGSNNVVTVSQSNAVLGTYKYTLVSVTDANGCSGTIPAPPANDATITVIAQVPNLSPVAFMDNINFTVGSVGINRDFIIEIDEIAGAASAGTITVRISKPSAFNISFNPVSGNSNVFGGTPNTNSDFTFADLGGFYQLTTTVPIGAFGFKIAGLMINRKPGIPPNTTQNISIQIVPGSGGDNTNGNNLNSLKVTAN
jgi:HYR domain